MSSTVKYYKLLWTNIIKDFHEKYLFINIKLTKYKLFKYNFTFYIIFYKSFYIGFYNWMLK